MAELTIRAATLDDPEAIARIYNQGIEDRLATLETTLRSPEERREWLNARGERGFETVGTYHEQGLLDGAWIDVILMEKILHDA